MNDDQTPLEETVSTSVGIKQSAYAVFVPSSAVCIAKDLIKTYQLDDNQTELYGVALIVEAGRIAAYGGVAYVLFN